ncbi:MAG: hypothetical protein HY601_02960 [Candidatus Omnitrophica bacterium]|nr:hypothetical protein [Candidatus Omnitrophota bacterium]
MGVLAAGLLVLTGLLTAAVGCAAAGSRLQSAHRLHRRTAALATAGGEEWHAWFVGGFSGMTLGVRWLRVAVLWGAWMAAALCLIGLGIRLV